MNNCFRRLTEIFHRSFLDLLKLAKCISGFLPSSGGLVSSKEVKTKAEGAQWKKSRGLELHLDRRVHNPDLTPNRYPQWKDRFIIKRK